MAARKPRPAPASQHFELSPKQLKALCVDADITIFGGGNGGGKSFALRAIPLLPPYFADDDSSNDQTAESSRSGRVRSAAAAAAVMDSEAPDDEELDEEEDGSTEGITMDAEAEGAARRALERDQLEALQDARERRHLRLQLESLERTARFVV